MEAVLDGCHFYDTHTDTLFKENMPLDQDNFIARNVGMNVISYKDNMVDNCVIAFAGIDKTNPFNAYEYEFDMDGSLNKTMKVSQLFDSKKVRTPNNGCYRCLGHIRGFTWRDLYDFQAQLPGISFADMVYSLLCDQSFILFVVFPGYPLVIPTYHGMKLNYVVKFFIFDTREELDTTLHNTLINVA